MTDPFTVWRTQQLAPAREHTEPELMTVTLRPGRQAYATIALCEYQLAKLRGESGDTEWARYQIVLEQQYALQAVENHQAAPRTIEACTAIINEAAQIIEELAR